MENVYTGCELHFVAIVFVVQCYVRLYNNTLVAFSKLNIASSRNCIVLLEKVSHM